MPARPCLTCGRVTSVGPRCEQHRRQRVRERSRQRGPGWNQYGEHWRPLRDAILARDGYRCFYCGGLATTADHVMPKALGGTDDPSNLVAACLPCNSSKRDRDHVPRLR